MTNKELCDYRNRIKRAEDPTKEMEAIIEELPSTENKRDVMKIVYFAKQFGKIPVKEFGEYLQEKTEYLVNKFSPVEDKTEVITDGE